MGPIQSPEGGEYHFRFTNPAQVIEDELKVYRDSQSFREGLFSIHRLYIESKASMALSMQKYAVMAYRAKAFKDSVEVQQGVANVDFYYGGILAMHAYTSCFNNHVRSHILRQYNEVAVPEPDDAQKIALQRMAVCLEFIDEPYAIFDCINDNYHGDMLVEAVERYADLVEDSEQIETQQSFLSGYHFGFENCYSAHTTYQPRHGIL